MRTSNNPLKRKQPESALTDHQERRESAVTTEQQQPVSAITDHDEQQASLIQVSPRRGAKIRINKKEFTMRTSNNPFSVLRKRKQPESARTTEQQRPVSAISDHDQQQTSLIQVSPRRAAKILINKKHRDCWGLKRSLTHKCVAGLPYIRGHCPKELRLPWKFVRAFNLFFEAYIKKQPLEKQPFEGPSQGEYVSALVAWANLTREEKNEYVIKAADMAKAEGIYFWKELASKYKYIKLLNKLRNYKAAAQVQQKADLLLGATKLILVANPNGLKKALARAPTGCKFSFANHVDRKKKREMWAFMESRGGSIIELHDYFGCSSLDSSDEDTSESSSSY